MDKAEKDALLKLIQKRPGTFNGKPVIGDTRLKVETVLYALAEGSSTEDLLTDFPELTEREVAACLLYAAETVR